LSNIFARLATPKSVPLFNSIHSIPSGDIYKGNKLILWFDKLTYKKHHHILAVSNEVLTDFDRCVGVKGHGTVLYNFIENKFWGNTAKKSFLLTSLKLVSVGNLRYPKNYPFAIEAFKTMPKGVTLDIFGEGEMRDNLQKQIDEFKLPVRLCGSCSNLESVLPQYDVFLMTSFYEGQPVSLLEAMACGLPSLLSDIPVLREVAGDNALYFNIDDPQNLVRLIESIQSGKFNLAELSEKSFERVEKIAKKDHYMKKLCQLYLA
jgi:glycosyltransferase involved in cell wall biosynthesis